jgi:hypothetical protein
LSAFGFFSGSGSGFGADGCSAFASGSTSALIGRFGVTGETYRWLRRTLPEE